MDKELANKFKLSRTLIDIGSSAIFLMSAVLLIAPATRLVGATGLGASVAAFTATSYSERRYANIAAKHFQQIDRESRSALKQTQAIQNLQTDRDLWQSPNRLIDNAYGNEQGTTQRLKAAPSHVESDRQKLQDQVIALSDQIDQLKALEVSLMALTKKSVAEAIDNWRTRLTQTLASKRIQVELSHRVDDWKSELAELYRHWCNQLDEIPNDLHQYPEAWAILHGATENFSNLKTRIINSSKTLEGKASAEHIQRLETELDAMKSSELVPRSELQKVVGNCQAQLAEFRSSLQCQTHSTLEFAEAIEAEVLSEQDPLILKLRSIISDLTSQLEEALKPHRFPGSSEQSRVGNSIIDYYYQAGITLDGIDWLETELGYKLRFYGDRNGSRFISSDLLNSNGAIEKLTHLTSALNAPQFARDKRSYHLVLDIQMRYPRHKEVSETDVTHLFTPIDKLVSQVIREMSRKSTIRIMGATGDGKDICAKYLLSQILQVESWYTRLHDPQHGSAEDYWGIPKVSTSGKELKQALKAIMVQMTEREASKRHLPVTLDILNEIDTQLDKEDKEQFLNLISRIRHLGMKLILTGQNPQVSRSGFQWADMEQMICFYQGSVALDAINRNLALEFKSDILVKQYNEISSVLQAKNKSLDDAKKHYFGLCVIPGKSPQWYQLPVADTIEIKCEPILLGKNFNIPISFREIVEYEISTQSSANSTKNDRSSIASVPSETLIGKGTAGIYDKTAIRSATSEKDLLAAPQTCKKHPDVELSQYKGGHYYCPSCKKKLGKLDIQ